MPAGTFGPEVGTFSRRWRSVGTWSQSTLSRSGALRTSAHPARAVAARSQRAHNLAESRTPARTRQVGLRGMGDKALCFRPKACCFRLWPGAQWHLTWRPPTPTRQKRLEARQTSSEDAALPTVGASMLLEPACLSGQWCQAGSAVEDRTDFGGAGGCTRVRVRRTARARQGVPRRLPALPASRGLLECWMLFNSRCCFHSRGPWITREKKRASRKRPSRKKQV